MDNPETMATLDTQNHKTQNEDKQKKTQKIKRRQTPPKTGGELWYILQKMSEYEHLNTLARYNWFVIFFMVFSATFNDISAIGGGNRSTRRKSPTCRKSLTNFIT